MRKKLKEWFSDRCTIRLFQSFNILCITVKKTQVIVEEIVSLSVYLDSTLSRRPQVNHVTKKAKVLFRLKFIRVCMIQTLWKRLVKSLVIPCLNYCTVAYLDASLILRTRLQRLASAGLRYIFRGKRDTLITYYRRQLGWLDNDSRRDYFAPAV